MQAIDSIADALGDPNLKDQISAAIGDAKTVGRILLGISIVTIVARLRSLQKGSLTCGWRSSRFSAARSSRG